MSPSSTTWLSIGRVPIRHVPMTFGSFVSSAGISYILNKNDELDKFDVGMDKCYNQNAISFMSYSNK